MPTFSDVSQFLVGQALGRTTVPSVDLSGKTYIVTGSNTGLGFECLKASKVILAVRSIEKGEKAKQSILQFSPSTQSSQVEVWSLDLSDYVSVLAFAKRVNTSLTRLDGFIANAGVELADFSITQGLETTIAINVVSTYLNAISVLPILERTAAQHNVQTTLTLVGSLIHTFGPDSQLAVPGGQNILKSLSQSDTADMAQRYPLSKLMLHLCFREFASRVSARDVADHRTTDVVVTNLVNPGWCASELGRHKQMSWAQNMIFSVIGRTAEQGSRTLVHGVTAGPETNGKYLSECQIKEQSAFVRSEKGRQLGVRLWKEVLDTLQRVDGTDEVVRLVK